MSGTDGVVFVVDDDAALRESVVYVSHAGHSE